MEARRQSNEVPSHEDKIQITNALLAKLKALDTDQQRYDLLSEINELGLTGLQTAVDTGEADRVADLLGSIENPELLLQLLLQKDQYHRNVLHRAVMKKYTGIITVFLNAIKGSNSQRQLLMTKEMNYTPLQLAIRNKHPEDVAALLDPIEDPKLKCDLVMEKDLLGRTTLHCAVANKDTRITIILLSHLESPEYKREAIVERDRIGQNTLRTAADEDNAAALDAILNALEKTVQLELLAEKDKWGENALHTAVKNGFTDNVSALLQPISKMRAEKQKHQLKKMRYEETLLIAAENGFTKIILLLLNAIKTLEMKHKLIIKSGKDYNSALHLAAARGDIQTVLALLDNLETPELKQQAMKLKNENNRTCLQVAALHEHTETVRVLEEALTKIEFNDAQVEAPQTAPGPQQAFPMPGKGVMGQAKASQFQLAQQTKVPESAPTPAVAEIENPTPADGIDAQALQ